MSAQSLSARNVELIRHLYDAFQSGDVAAVLGCISPDLVWNEAENFPYADGNPYIGPAAVANGVFARCASERDGFAVVVDELLDAGDTVIALIRYRGTFRATGCSQNTRAVHIWRIIDGRIVRIQQYADTLQVARVTGRT